MKPLPSRLAVWSLLFAISGAAISVEAGDRKCRPLLDASRKHANGIAVTLAGGGTKASSFSMGVLAALASERLEASAAAERGSTIALWNTDLISTVSGGSYAGYFLFSRLIHAPATTPARADLVKGYFADCIPGNLENQFNGLEQIKEAEAKHRGTTKDKLFCAPYANAVRDADTDKGRENVAKAQIYWDRTRPETLHQQFLRCHQDVLVAGLCDFGATSAQLASDERRNLSSGAALTLVTAVSLPAAWTANFLFDWPLNVSPSRVVYRDGIGLAFGLRPKDARAIMGTTTWAANVAAVDGAKFANDQLIPDPDKLDFASLKTLATGRPDDPPRWVINATAAPSRHLLGWWSQNDIDFDRHIFRMSGDEQCAESVGPIPVDHHSLWDQAEPDANLSPLLTAVNASAAFFDSNEQVLGQPWRLLAGIGLQASNLNWGIDLINYDQDHQRRASKVRERLHEAAPFPIYLAEAASAEAADRDPVFVRLVDGGSADNLGAYGPIVEGVRDVIVSDHAQDTSGALKDLCYLHNELFLRRGLHLHIPGLQRWPQGCLPGSDGQDTAGARVRLATRLEDLRRSGESAVNPEFYYPIWGWPYPFLAGCVSDDPDPAVCLGTPPVRLWIIKPAFDYPHWLRSQTRCQKEPDPEDPSCTTPPTDGTPNLAITGCGANDELPCETAAVLIQRNRYLRDASPFATPDFPQGSTVQMTFNSSANVYGAYRELADHYTRQVIRSLDLVRADPGGQAFGRIMCWQQTHPIKGSSKREDLEFLPAWTDIRLSDWGNRERDAARIGLGKTGADNWPAVTPECAKKGDMPLAAS